MHGYCMVKILPHQYSGRCWITNVSNQWLPLGAGMIVSDSTDAFFFRVSVFQVFSSQQWHTQELPGKNGKAEGDSAVARRFHYSGTLAGSLGHVERGADPSLCMPCRKLVDRGGSIAWEGETLDSNCILIGPWFLFCWPSTSCCQCWTNSTGETFQESLEQERCLQLQWKLQLSEEASGRLLRARDLSWTGRIYGLVCFYWKHLETRCFPPCFPP